MLKLLRANIHRGVVVLFVRPFFAVAVTGGHAQGG
jgi:hypothetical protein